MKYSSVVTCMIWQLVSVPHHVPGLGSTELVHLYPELNNNYLKVVLWYVFNKYILYFRKIICNIYFLM